MSTKSGGKESSMERVFILVASTNHGRYALDRSDGVHVTAETRLVVLLGGYGIVGIVEHGQAYSSEDGIERGYFFIADSGECCGVCANMQVRVS
jgi:hypothetical protein